MPISYTIKKEQGIIVSKHEGNISDRELVDVYKALFQDPSLRKGYRKLVDLRSSKSTERSMAALIEVADMVKQYYSGSTETTKTAIVASHDLYFGLARTYELISDEYPDEIMVFRDVDKALEWLDVGPDVLEDIRQVNGS